MRILPEDAGAGATDTGSAAQRRVAVTHTEAKLRTNVPRKVAGSSYYASFDFNFLRLAIQLGQQAVDVRDDGRNVLHDQGIGAIVRDDIATLAQQLLGGGNHVFGARIAEESRDRNFFHGQGFRFLLSAAGFRFLLECFHGGYAKNVAFEVTVEFVVFQNDVESLIPRYIVEDESQRALDLRIQNNVQAADLMNEAEEVFEINVFQVDRDRLACVLGADGGGLRSLPLRLLFSSQVDGSFGLGSGVGRIIRLHGRA